MAEKKKSISAANFVASIVIIALFVFGGFVSLYIIQDNALQAKNNQILNLQGQLSSPKLIEINLQYADNRSDPNAPFLQVTFIAVNVGASEARR